MNECVACLSVLPGMDTDPAGWCCSCGVASLVCIKQRPCCQSRMFLLWPATSYRQAQDSAMVHHCWLHDSVSAAILQPLALVVRVKLYACCHARLGSTPCTHVSRLSSICSAQGINALSSFEDQVQGSSPPAWLCGRHTIALVLVCEHALTSPSAALSVQDNVHNDMLGGEEMEEHACLSQPAKTFDCSLVDCVDSLSGLRRPVWRSRATAGWRLSSSWMTRPRCRAPTLLPSKPPSLFGPS